MERSIPSCNGRPPGARRVRRSNAGVRSVLAGCRSRQRKRLRSWRPRPPATRPATGRWTLPATVVRPPRACHWPAPIAGAWPARFADRERPACVTGASAIRHAVRSRRIALAQGWTGRELNRCAIEEEGALAESWQDAVGFGRQLLENAIAAGFHDAQRQPVPGLIISRGIAGHRPGFSPRVLQPLTGSGPKLAGSPRSNSKTA